MGELPAEIEANREALTRLIVSAIPSVLAIYAYGSRVRGAIHPQSDLDLALLLPRTAAIPPNLLCQLRGDLEALMGYPVEVSVLDLNSQLIHCKEVVAHGIPIYVADANSLAVFEMQTLSYYARLCEDRRPIVEAYREERLG